MDEAGEADVHSEYSDEGDVNDFNSSAASDPDENAVDVMADDDSSDNSVGTIGDEIAIDEETAEEIATEEFKSYATTKNQIHKTIIVIQPMRRRTSNIITKPELVEAIGIRAAQIAQKPTVFVDINTKNGAKLDDPIVMAKMEVAQRRFPLILRRIVKTQVDKKTGHNTEWVEDWDVNKMILPLSVKL